MISLDSWYLSNLVCPIDGASLDYDGESLRSKAGRIYPVVDGVPVLLVEEEQQTLSVARASIDRAQGRTDIVDQRAPQYYLETLGISDAEKTEVVRIHSSKLNTIDPVVMMIMHATSGNAYKSLIGDPNVREYPIPNIELPSSVGASLLDLGCNWGRWSIAAARKGYCAVGLDPSLGAVMAARRVAGELGLDIKFVVGDGRFLPFQKDSFDYVYSYSVLQHFSKEDARKTLSKIGTVLKPGGVAKIQMANKLGIRSLQYQLSRIGREQREFDVRYWTVGELVRTFSELVGKTEISTDCYFGLGWQWSDLKLLPLKLRPVLVASEFLKRLSNGITPMRLVADSVFCTASKPPRDDAGAKCRQSGGVVKPIGDQRPC